MNHTTRRPIPVAPLTPSRGASSSSEPVLRVLPLDPRATLPAYQSAGPAGLDLAVCLSVEEEADGVVLAPGRIRLFSCGFAVAIPPGYEGQVRPRSGLATRHGVTIPNAPGTIDCDYRGEMRVALINLGQEPYTVRHAARVAQLVIAPVQRVRVELADSLDQTDRGVGGFGSTGGH